VRTRVEIWNELTEISPTVAKISSENVFKAPSGYFENFASTVLSMAKAGSVRSEMEGLSPLLCNISTVGPYAAPLGYFENFASLLTTRIKNGELEEGRAIAPILGSDEKKNAYAVPDGYFEGFAERMLLLAQADQAGSVSEELEFLSPVLSKLNKETPFTVPQGYFHGLSENAVSGAKAVDFVNTELENLSPLMAELKTKQPYEVPIGYFEGFAQSLLPKIKEKQPARLIGLHTWKNITRYAAAAAVIAVIATSAFWFFRPKRPMDLATIAGKQLVDSLHSSNDEEILGYLLSHNVPIVDSSSNTVASIDLNDEAADDMLADVPDNELQQYLDEHYGTKELSTN